MADNTSLEDPAEPGTPAPLPEKEWWKSNSMWASIVTFATGLLTLVSDGELAQTVATFLATETDNVIGFVMTGLGLYTAFSTLRRNTKLKIGK